MMIRGFLLLLLLWSVEGSKSVYPGTDTEENFSGSGSDGDAIPCCGSGNYTFYSIVDALNGATSNTIINLSGDVVLSSNVTLKGLYNLTIIGKDNPNVKCNGIGLVSLISCKNVTIEGITFNRCSPTKNPGIQFYNTSDIAIQGCSFHHSTGKALAFSKVSGNVFVNNCQFSHNQYFRGHGAAIYYTSYHELGPQLVINNSIFTFNGPAKSAVYIDNSSNKANGNVSFLQSSIFIQNQGVSIYISHTSLILNYIVSFENNKAINGGAIHSRDSIIKFDDKCNVRFLKNSAKYGGVIYQTHSLMLFGKNSIVLFANNTASACGGAIYQFYSKLLFTMNAEVIFSSNVAKDDKNRNQHVFFISGGAVHSFSHSLISFQDQAVVTFNDNRAIYGGALFVSSSSDIIFRGNSTLLFFNNSVTEWGGSIKASSGCCISFLEKTVVNFTRNSALQGGAADTRRSIITFHGHSTVIFSRNYAYNVGGAFATLGDTISIDDNSTMKFIDNSVTNTGGGAVYLFSSKIKFNGNSSVTFKNNSVGGGGGAIMIRYFLILPPQITFTGYSTVLFLNNSAKIEGGAISLDSQNKSELLPTKVTFTLNSQVVFSNNTAKHGGALFFSGNPHELIFQRDTNIAFVNNQATYGGAVYLFTTSHITLNFTGGTVVTFCNNTASLSGGAILFSSNSPLQSSAICFAGESTIHFINNIARQHGGAMHFITAPLINFKKKSMVKFDSNAASLSGGAISSSTNSTIWFTGSSTISFKNNLARQHGGAIYSLKTAQIEFAENSTAEFSNNTASLSGGAISLPNNSNIWFTGESIIHFANNLARQHGGAISSVTNAVVAFHHTCSVVFTRNTALQQGGAVYLFEKCTITFRDSCKVSYNNNTALQQGGAVYFALQSYVSFSGKSVVQFGNNKAILSGGALFSITNKPIQIEESSTISFYHNTVRQDGGAIQCVNTALNISGSSFVTFSKNTALQQGGAVNLFHNSVVTLQGESNVTFAHNTAMQHGGALYVHDNSSVKFHGKTIVVFHHNLAESDGGALYSYDHCKIMIGQHCEVMFAGNNAMQYGGAMYCDHDSDIILEGKVTFTSNTAEHGGAVCISQSIMKFANKSVVLLSSNRAVENGGGLYLTDNYNVSFDHGSSFKFVHNTANRYGGALYSDLNKEGYSKLKLNSTKISFTSNKALSGNSVYLDIPTSCDIACLSKSIDGVNKETLKHGSLGKYIHTPPSKLVLHYPAVCVNDDNVNNCGRYFVSSIMLGQEIIIHACVLDYYDQPAKETQFTVNSNDEDLSINGTNDVLISCNELQGIKIRGSEILNATNFTMNLTSHTGSRSDLKTISIELTTELSPCHPGFYYNDLICVCYHDNDIITCSGSTSLIRRGYWFGVVNDKSTVTVCPNNYCNFTCCAVTNGFYKLSPVRMNQCSSHRSGAACGSCEEGYTLSFDSIACVRLNKCTTGQTILVVTLSMIYWIAIVIVVFIMTYYHVGIGYLYAITYYYSMLDILLSHSFHQSKNLFTAVSIISSVVKLTPQFLGQICLVKDMSGIDQQFIHYTHPLAVSVIVVIICQAARISYKFSSFISRGIIRTVCFLLLLSYTSVATTSLLLLRSLTFDNVDKVYTYLSPDIEYCQGRHLPYFIVAVLSTLVIVIGLPFLLLLEPFVNHKINFTRIKPLLDQFQGCYKNKYRCFGAYYMICRLVIIVIIISNPSNNNLLQLLLYFSTVISTVIMAILKPYDHNIINIFDGLILLLMVLATLVPVADSINQELSTAIIIFGIILPLMFFIILELIVYEEKIKLIIQKINAKFKTNPLPITATDNNIQLEMHEKGLIIDDNIKRNATTFEM